MGTMADDPYARIAELEAELRQSRAEADTLRAEKAAVSVERDEALKQQTATAEILRGIASSPTDADPVLDAIVQSAVRLSTSTHGLLWLRDGDLIRVAVVVNAPSPAGRPIATSPVGHGGQPSPLTTVGRSLLDRRTIHVPDRSDPAFAEEFPESIYRERISSLFVPLVREGDAIGVLTLQRDAAQPYSAGEIALVETFADQAVIAIENARLFEELEQRNAELGEALEQQAA